MDNREFQELLEGVGGEMSRRISSLSPPHRALHQKVLRYFSATGAPPSPTVLQSWAAELGTDLPEGLAQLVAVDLVECDPDLALVKSAYPFSASAVGHAVQVREGAAVEACCAVDSLGISPMLGKPVTVTSADAHTGERVVVEVGDGKATSLPGRAVVTMPIDLGSPEGQACQVSCPKVNFFTSPETSLAYQREHGVELLVLSLAQALQFASAAFGEMLEPATARTGEGR